MAMVLIICCLPLILSMHMSHKNAQTHTTRSILRHVANHQSYYFDNTYERSSQPSIWATRALDLFLAFTVQAVRMS